MSKREQDSTNTPSVSPSQIQREQQVLVNKALDETRDNIKNTVSNVVDNFVTATRLANRTVFANTELVNMSLQQARNNAREYSRIGVNAAKNFHEAANEVAKIGFSAVEPTVPTQRRQ